MNFFKSMFLYILNFFDYFINVTNMTDKTLLNHKSLLVLFIGYKGGHSLFVFVWDFPQRFLSHFLGAYKAHVGLLLAQGQLFQYCVMFLFFFICQFVESWCLTARVGTCAWIFTWIEGKIFLTLWLWGIYNDVLGVWRYDLTLKSYMLNCLTNNLFEIQSIIIF